MVQHIQRNQLSYHLSPFSPVLTISLCRPGHYLSHPVFSTLCHVFSRLVFRQVSLYGVPPSLFRPTSAPSPRHFPSYRFRTDVVRFSSQSVTKPLYTFVFQKGLNIFHMRLLPDVFISDVIHHGLPSCPSQIPHFG